MSFAIFNGKVVEEQKINIPISNRSFLYGDGLFESIRVFQRKVPLLTYHVSRLLRDAQRLKMNVPENFAIQFFHEEIEKLLEVNELENARIKILFYRESNGFYTPHNNDIGWIITAAELSDHKLRLNEDGLETYVYTENLKAITNLSNMKSSSALLYVMAAKYAKDHFFDDVFVINQKGSFIETSRANIFLKLDERVVTPPLRDGCLDGVMRQYLLDNMKKSDYKLTEMSVDESMVERADEIILTNAVQGIQWVRNYRNTNYVNKFATRLVNALNKRWELL